MAASQPDHPNASFPLTLTTQPLVRQSISLRSYSSSRTAKPLKPITHSSDFGSLYFQEYQMFREKQDMTSCIGNSNTVMVIYCGFWEQSSTELQWPPVESYQKQSFLMRIMPDGTFTLDAASLVVENSILQHAPPAFVHTATNMRAGEDAILAQKTPPQIKNRRCFIMRMKEKVPLTGNLYSLCYLLQEYDVIEELFLILRVSLSLICDCYPFGKATLVTAHQFLIPVLEDRLPSAPISEESLVSGSRLGARSAPREFVEHAAYVVTKGHGLARTCYREGVRRCGLVLEFSIMVPEDRFADFS